MCKGRTRIISFLKGGKLDLRDGGQRVASRISCPIILVVHILLVLVLLLSRDGGGHFFDGAAG